MARNLKEAVKMLCKLETELNTRKNTVLSTRSRDVIKSFQPIALIIDEAASLSPSQHTGDDKVDAVQCDNIISLIGQQGREPKIFCLYSTQRPDAKVINRQYKANCEASIAFRVKDHYNSEIIIDRPGAEKIPVSAKGRCIYSSDQDVELQVPYIGSDDDWHKLLLPYRTEIVHHGESHRKDAPRNIIDGDVEVADSVDPTCLTALSAPSTTTKDSIQDVSPTKETKARREHVESVTKANEDLEVI